MNLIFLILKDENQTRVRVDEITAYSGFSTRGPREDYVRLITRQGSHLTSKETLADFESRLRGLVNGRADMLASEGWAS